MASIRGHFTAVSNQPRQPMTPLATDWLAFGFLKKVRF